MEIGSEFWFENVTTDYNIEKPDWIDAYGNSVLTSSGRGAISLLLEEINPKARTALLPSYTCETVILPFIKHGYTCYFYDINPDMTPNLKDIDENGDIGVFLHMGFYGFSTNCVLSNIVKEFKTRSTIIIEDITHTLFSDYPRFEQNDYYVTSLRKWTGLPSGGFLATRGTIASVPRTNEEFAQYRKEALQIKAKYINSGNEELKTQYLNLFDKGERLLDSDVTPYHIDTISKGLLNVLDVKRLKEKRRNNFITLLKGLEVVDYFVPVFNSISNDVCPMFFPIYIDKNRNEVRQKLIEQKIYCPIHWPVPKQIDLGKYKSAKKIYETILSIPCDQRYDIKDMERIILALVNL